MGGISKNIVITNDKDRLTEDQIQDMVRDAEVNKAADDKAKKLISERNSLEHLVYTTKAQLDNEQLKAKFSDVDKKAITDICDSTLRFSSLVQMPRFKSSRRRPRLSTM